MRAFLGPQTAAAAAPSAAAPAAAPPRTSNVLLPGQLLKGRQADIPREPMGLMNLVHNWTNKSVLPQSKINGLCKSVSHMVATEMVPILNELKKEHDVKTITGEFKTLFADAIIEPVLCWERNGDKIEAKLDQVTGGMAPRDLKKEINSSTLGRLNHFLAVLQCYIKEETDARCVCASPPVPGHPRCFLPMLICSYHMLLAWLAYVLSGKDLIQDRLEFGAHNLKAMLNRRDEWAIKASEWLDQARKLKRKFEDDKVAAELAEARQRALRKRATEGASAASCKKMRVLRDAGAKEKYPGSITVAAGDTCELISACTNASWSLVKMLDGASMGTEGNVPTVKLQEIKLQEMVLEDPTDSEAEDDGETSALPVNVQQGSTSGVENFEPAPYHEVLVKGVNIIWESLEHFSLTEFCEDDDFQGFSEEAVHKALKKLAATNPELLQQDQERPFVFLKPV